MANLILNFTKLRPEQFVMLFIPKGLLVFFNQYLPIEEKEHDVVPFVSLW